VNALRRREHPGHAQGQRPARWCREGLVAVGADLTLIAQSDSLREGDSERGLRDRQTPGPPPLARPAVNVDGLGVEHTSGELNREPLRRYLWKVAAATLLVAVCPVLVVWWLRTSGAIRSAPLGMILALSLSLGASYLGSAFWKTRTTSGDLLFGELMVWGFVRRWRAERRVLSAVQLIGSMNHAQTSVTGPASGEGKGPASGEGHGPASGEGEGGG
jgi:hypothetical protein